MPDVAPIVEVSDLRKRYGRVEALSGLDLTVNRGEIFGVLGPNGAGKTTLIRSLVGSTRPDSGRVRVLDLDPASHAQALRHRIGYMPQAPALYEELSARDNVRFFASAHLGADVVSHVERSLELVGLQTRAADPVHGLSGGMKQRVSLACALVHEPRLLLLDEPTAGVDPKLRESFWQHFRAVSASGVTVLISTHQMDEALFCDRLAILRAGRVLVCDTPRGLLDRGRTTVRLRHGASDIERVLERPTEQLPVLLREFGLDPSVTRLDVQPDTLETVVLSLIERDAAHDRDHHDSPTRHA